MGMFHTQETACPLGQRTAIDLRTFWAQRASSPRAQQGGISQSLIHPSLRKKRASGTESALAAGVGGSIRHGSLASKAATVFALLKQKSAESRPRLPLDRVPLHFDMKCRRYRARPLCPVGKAAASGFALAVV